MKVACQRCNEIVDRDSRMFGDKWEIIKTEYRQYCLCERCVRDFYKFLNEAEIKSGREQ